MKRSLVGVLVALALLVTVLVLRAAPRGPERAVEAPAPLDFDAGAAVERFAAGLRFETVSFAEDAPRPRDPESFLALHRHLEASYPAVHATLERETVSDLTLLYTWRGSDPSLAPMVLLGHTDVVPVEPGSEDRWERPPFSGAVTNGHIWGRGALDDKVNVYGILEAAEALLREGFRPRRSVHFSFGHDEELGGDDGAQRVAALLEARGVRPALVVDEGGAVAAGLFPGADFPIAVVGVAEKGYVSVELVVEAAGGHSSAPPRETGIGILARAVAAVEANPLPSRFEGPLRKLVERVGERLDLPYRLVTRNLWLFGPAVKQALLAIPQSSAALRTTTAPTIIQAGVKDNVLPSRARAVVNFRIYPGDTIEDIVEHVRDVVGDPRVEVQALPKRREASEMSPTDGEAFALVARTIAQVFPAAVVAPHLIPGGTDARHFRSICDNVYGFMPVRLGADDLGRMHGLNERIGVDAYRDAVRWYAQLLRNAAE